MSVTFLTNEDGSVFQQSIEQLSEEIVEITDDVTHLIGEDKSANARFLTITERAGTMVSIESDAANAIHTGKNLFDVGTSAEDYGMHGQNSGLISVNNKTQTMVMTVGVSSSCRVIRNTRIPVCVGDKIAISTYCDSHSKNVARSMLMALDSDGNVVTTGVMRNGNAASYIPAYCSFIGPAGAPAVFEIVGNDIAYMCIGVGAVSDYGVETDDHITVRVQAEMNDATTDYEAFVGHTIALSNGKGYTTVVEGVNHVFADNGEAITATWSSAGIPLSVNGKIGNVVLTAEDVGAIPNSYGLTGHLGYITPQQYGAQGDGVTDDTDAFAACILEAKRTCVPIRISNGNYYVTTIALLEGVEVTADANAIFTAVDDNSPMLIPATNSKWSGGHFIVGKDYAVGVVSVTDTTLTGADIRTKATGAWNNDKNSYSYAAIILRASQNNYICFNNFSMEATNFTYGLYATSEDGSFNNTCNFDLMLWTCSNHIYLHKVNATNIKFQAQAGFKTSDDCYGIYVDGLSRWNIFDGFVNDIGITASNKLTTNRYAYFGHETSDNVLTVAPHHTINVQGLTRMMQDDGVNRIGGMPQFYGAFFPPNSQNNAEHATDLIGDQDNYLAYADRRSDISIGYEQTGVVHANSVSYGLTPNGMFYPGQTTGIYKEGEASFDRTEIEKITITFATAVHLSSFGFTTNGNADFDTELEFYDDDGLIISSEITKNMTESRSSFIHVPLLEGLYDQPSQRTKKIVITIKNITANVYIGTMYACVKGVIGNTFLPKGGGDLYGDVSFAENAGIIIRSENGTRYKVKVSDDGALSAEVIE